MRGSRAGAGGAQKGPGGPERGPRGGAGRASGGPFRNVDGRVWVPLANIRRHVSGPKARLSSRGCI